MSTIPPLLDRVLLHPAPGPLWFLRELLIYTLASPLIYFALRYRGKLVLALLALWWYLFPSPERLFLAPRGVLFFCAGAWMALNAFPLDSPALRKRRWPLLISWVALVWVKTGLALFAAWNGTVLHNTSLALGLLAMWTWYDSAPQALAQLLARLAPYTIFVFAAHQHLLNLWSRGFYLLWGNASVSRGLLAYLLSPALAVATALCLAVLLKRFSPRLYPLSTGWR